MAASFLPKATIAWSRVFALAAVQNAIVLSWVMYRLYLPDLFAQVGLAASVVGTVLFFEVAIGFILEPLMGYGSDRLRRWTGTRFPLILAGVLLTVVMFFALPPIAGLGAAAQSALPLAAVIWAMAMAAFRAPVLVMLGQCAMSSGDLPYAAGVLMAIGAIVGRLIPMTTDFWLSRGAMFTFVSGSVVLLVAIGVLRAVLPAPAPPADPSDPGDELTLDLRHLVVALLRTIAVAVGVIWTGNWFGALVPRLYAGTELTPWSASSPIQVGLVGAASCLVAAALGQRFGMRRTIAIAAPIGLAAILGLSVSGTTALGTLLIVAIVAVQSAINVGVIPLALEIAPPGFGGVAIGMYFGTLGLAGNAFGKIFGDLSDAAPTSLAQGGAFALLLVALGFGLQLWPTTRPELENLQE